MASPASDGIDDMLAKQQKHAYYMVHREKFLKRQALWRATHPEQVKAQHARHKKDRIESFVGTTGKTKVAEDSWRWRRRHPEQARQESRKQYWRDRDHYLATRRAKRKEPSERKKTRAYCGAYYPRVRMQVVTAYGGQCKLCGEKRPECLNIDHVQDDGAARRREGKETGISLYLRLRRENYPKEYQLLCYNCNIMKYRLYVKRQKEERNG